MIYQHSTMKNLRAVGLRTGSFVCVFSATTVAVGLAWGQADRPASTVVLGASSTQTSKPKTIIAADIAAAAPIEAWKPGDPIKPTNPRTGFADRQERVQRITIPAGKIDGLLGFQQRASLFAAEPALSKPILNFEGLGFSGVNPPDTVGDVGKNFYIQAINEATGTRYNIYKKDGTKAAGPLLLSDLGGSRGSGDPVVLYDHLADRWLITEFAPRGDNKLLVYVSKDSNPLTTAWHFYSFDTPNFPDYPKYGLWPDAYYVTTNESDGPAIYAMDRTKMLAGESATMQRFLAKQLNGFNFQALTPCDLDGPAPPNKSPHFVMRHRDDEVHNSGANDASQDFLDLYELRIHFSDPSASALSGPVGVPISEFDSSLCGLTSFNCFPQKGSTTRLDPLREVIMNRLQYRNFGTHETIVGSFVTDVNGSDHGGVRWFEMRKTAVAEWHVHQEGTYAPDSHNRWMSSIAMDGNGNIALAYNISSDTIFPGLRYTGRLASDPMATMPQPERVIMDGAAANASMRYGDYAALSVDPSDDRLFWFTGQHNNKPQWTTRIATFHFEPAGLPSPDPTATAPELGTVEQRLDALEELVKRLLRELEQNK